MDTNPDWGYKCATLFQRRKSGVLLSETRVKNMDKEFLRQIDQADEFLTQIGPEKLADDVLICECFCVSVRDIREACSEKSEVDLELLRRRFSMGEGCQSCVRAAPEWVNKIF
jgi:NAD(P)H-nitrite reductase large subunit